MTLLSLAIKSRVPLIGVQTPDTVFLPDYLYHLTGDPVLTYKNGQKEIKEKALYTYTEPSALVSVEETYERFGAKDSVLIVNEHRHPIILDTGRLVLSTEYMHALLSELAPKIKKELLPVLAGCTEKEIQDVLSLTEARDGELTVRGVQSTRQLCTPARQGLELVHSDLRGYVPDPRVRELAVHQKRFFLGDYDYRLRPRGLLATGPSGTGKTAAAKWLAEQWGVPLYRLSAGVQDKWVGSSEANLAAALSQVESLNGCVFLLDEVEKFFGQQNDQGVTQQMLGSVLWWMQEHRSRVFTYMTCNTVSIPPELHRAGRIDQVLEFKELSTSSLKFGATVSKVLKSYNLTDAQREELLRVVTEDYDFPTGSVSYAELDGIIRNEIRKVLK